MESITQDPNFSNQDKTESVKDAGWGWVEGRKSEKHGKKNIM